MSRRSARAALVLAVLMPGMTCGRAAGFVVWDWGWPAWSAGLVGTVVAGLAVLVVRFMGRE